LCPIVICIISLIVTQATYGAQPSAFGSGFDVQDFFRPFTLDEITPKNQQKWPYYKWVSANWDDFALHGTAKVTRSAKPAKLTVAQGDERLDLNTEFQDGRSFIESLQATQTKGFVVMKDNKILAEFYDNGFNVDQTNLLQSASKTFVGVITNQLVDKGLLDPQAKVQTYLRDFGGTDIGAATVQQVLDMTSGLPTLLDLYTPGAPGQLWEVEIGLQPGKPKGHRKAIKSTPAVTKPSEAWMYTDKNTDTLGLLAEQVTGKKYAQLLSELFDAFGANYDGSIALTSDGTTSPSYGISITARDYALFHQWIAQDKAPKSYYTSAMDTSKTKFGENETAVLLGSGITYGSQSYYLEEHDILYSSGSYGEIGYSDMKTGVSVVIYQDWAVNWELEKGYITRDRALAIINHLRGTSDHRILRGRRF
ncbi:MAG: serine hydrolase domain-containing protein, partial [Planctomycetota bacterium]